MNVINLKDILKLRDEETAQVNHGNAKEQDTQPQPHQFEVEFHADYLLIKRYKVSTVDNKTYVQTFIHSIIISDNVKDKLNLIRGIKPPKFFFSQLVKNDRKIENLDLIVNQTCVDIPYLKITIFHFGDINPFNIDNSISSIREFLIDFTIKEKDILIFCPDEWFDGVRRNWKEIVSRLKKVDSVFNWSKEV